MRRGIMCHPSSIGPRHAVQPIPSGNTYLKIFGRKQTKPQLSFYFLNAFVTFHPNHDISITFARRHHLQLFKRLVVHSLLGGSGIPVHHNAERTVIVLHTSGSHHTKFHIVFVTANLQKLHRSIILTGPCGRVIPLFFSLDIEIDAFHTIVVFQILLAPGQTNAGAYQSSYVEYILHCFHLLITFTNYLFSD